MQTITGKNKGILVINYGKREYPISRPAKLDPAVRENIQPIKERQNTFGKTEYPIFKNELKAEYKRPTI